MTTLDRLATNGPMSSPRVAIVAALAAAAVGGSLVAVEPAALAIACTVVLLSIALTSPAARFAIVIAGGLLVFRTSDQLDATKSLYLVWVGISTALAITGLLAEGDGRRLADFRPLLVASGAVVGALSLSFVVAMSSGTALIDWIRDASPYGLLAVSPFLAWSGARSALGSHMEAVAVAAGCMATVAFAVEWLGRRGLADLPVATLGSSSITLSALVFAVAAGAILSKRPRRLLWVILAAAVLTLLLTTGTRSALVLLVGPVAMVFSHGQRFRRAGRLAGAVVVVGPAALALAFLAIQSGLIDVARLTERLGSLFSLGSNLSADQSYIERATQVGVATSAFAESPVVGVGLGFKFEWARFGGASLTTYTIDTGLSIVAKFGVIGLGLLGIATFAVLTFFRRLRRALPEHLRLSFVGFVATSIAMLPLGNVFEDKGFGLAVAILVAWALASATATRARNGSPEAGA